MLYFCFTPKLYTCQIVAKLKTISQHNPFIARRFVRFVTYTCLLSTYSSVVAKRSISVRGSIVFAGIAIAIVCVILAYYLLDKRARVPNLPDPPLYVLAQKHNIKIGNFAIYIRLNEKPYREILRSEHNLALADNTPNWYFTGGGLRPTQNSFNFKEMDSIVNFAEENNMSLEAHHYLWGEEKWLPEWLKNGAFTQQQLSALIKEHILTVGGRYKGRIETWTVVNETFSRRQNIYGLNDWWYDQFKNDSFLDDAFKWARKADPNANLLINDFNNEAINDISNATYDYIKSAKQRGIPIDGLGMQMHIDGTHPPTKDEVKSNMKRFHDLGLDIYITEFDVNMNDVKASPKSKDEIQANIYYEMARACVESPGCKSFAMLGITDKETWYSHLGLPDPRPLPFDKQYKPKPAYFALRRAFSED